MKRALTIAAALVHNPPLIFLDEPTTGLDVMSARRLRQMVTMLREEGVTIFLTTHYLEEADRLCDRVAVIVKGQIVALDRVEKLKAAAQDRTVVEITVEDSQGAQEKHRLEVNDGVQAAVERLLAGLNGRRLLAINTLRPSLEDVFVKLTGLNAEIMLIEKGGKGGSGNG
jgi:ABC-2 type transport system ATP-binding protein